HRRDDPVARAGNPPQSSRPIHFQPVHLYRPSAFAAIARPRGNRVVRKGTRRQSGVGTRARLGSPRPMPSRAIWLAPPLGSPKPGSCQVAWATPASTASGAVNWESRLSEKRQSLFGGISGAAFDIAGA